MTPRATVMKRKLVLMAVLTLWQMWLAGAATAQEPAIPSFWDSREQLAKPDLSGVQRIRFLTTVDYPPFSYIDQNGRLGGFNVELARAICQELDIVSRCQIQGLPWAELEQTMQNGSGEAVIAGLAVTAETRERYAFTRPYLQFPARFVTRRDSDWAEPMHEAVGGQRIGVVAGSGHEAMLREHFSRAEVVTFPTAEALYTAMRDGEVAGIFGDGMRFSFWLSGANSQACCRFAGGPYLDPDNFGPGMAIAVERQDEVLAEAFDYALKQLDGNGRFAELYLRYFPTSFY